jgi:hypothetical protein
MLCKEAKSNWLRNKYVYSNSGQMNINKSHVLLNLTCFLYKSSLWYILYQYFFQIHDFCTILIANKYIYFS